MYVSKRNAETKTFDFTSQIINSSQKFDSSEINGIILHDGDLRITGTGKFTGVIITTGKLTIESQVEITADKDLTASVIINNYLDADGYTSGSFGEGTLFNTFAYDGSGTTYSIINFYDSNSNMVNINELIGITNWEKQRYGRL